MLDARALLLLVGALLGASLAPLGSSSIAVAIPIIAEAIDADISRVTQLLVGSYLFVCIVGQVPGGKLADRFGAMPILFFGLVMFIVGCLLGYFVQDLIALTLSRMSMAMGTALISPSTQALIRIRLPGPQLPFAFGIFGTVMSGAAALGPWVGGLIVSNLHWSWIFAVNLPIAILAGVLIFSSIDRRSEAEVRQVSPGSSSIDWQGVVLLGVAVLALQIGLGESNPTVMFALVITSALNSFCWISSA